MAFRDLTDPAAVVKAMREFDEIGRERFLKQYGFGQSNRYLIEWDGKQYDSKAIVGAAHGYQFPELGPLDRRDLFGGRKHACRKLEQLGFRVVEVTDVDGVVPAPSSRARQWSDEENSVILNAYFRMLQQELAGHRFSKADVSREVQERLQGRSRGAIEYKFQNVSAVLHEFGLPFVEGYKPARNYQRSLREVVLATAEEVGIYDSALDYAPTADIEELDRRERRIAVRGPIARPDGNSTPGVVEIVQSARLRVAAVKRWILQEANGICEFCGEPGPFTLPDGSTYLEVHHVLPLAEGGPDVVSNAVAVCPNCHRRLHLSVDRDECTAALYARVTRLVHPS